MADDNDDSVREEVKVSYITCETADTVTVGPATRSIRTTHILTEPISRKDPSFRDYYSNRLPSQRIFQPHSSKYIMSSNL
jgi:hypothetical protein